ncbi:pyruvate, water dikinase regulatory protein [Melaminivora jejuensis]
MGEPARCPTRANRFFATPARLLLTMLPPHTRTAFYISDGTGITAETFGNAILAQFDVRPRHVRLPFIDTEDKAHQVVRQVNHTAELEGSKPIVFTTLVNPSVLAIIEQGCKGMLLDMFGTFIRPLEAELGVTSHHRVGRFSDISMSKEYSDRIEAINFSLDHDDGQSHRDLEGADVILVGVSRSGKTPTSLYLAMQHGLKVANYPLIPEDFERRQLPPALAAHRKKIFGLTIDPQRLAEIRNERRPGSKYADLANCRYEISEAEAMMRRSGIRWLSSTTKSIEEIATTILQEVRPERLAY